ncbi:UDP-3-O-(3-hydroxymyristoyl)glucosamine N-acyltransferase [Urbifossiella limnaea]|uniref:UDP-3-O-acylglucosamine N-acyltransferase n=1 Tax=Urbifossiella limnaea TaxID=2528023 RepID=A0A517XUC8_9BACT|nr:UDP-3-O-(3-hydroxymyristoyl)glucosamine N-acyltransferase [Urbifossiella limnaea]QDU21117.1 UDP-3-O-acylglucosamine N-acyltransferase [Urbifossiella limnaea]
MSVTVRQLAEWVRGEVLGDGDLAVEDARTLTDARAGDITFVDGEKHAAAWHASPAAAAVAPPSIPVNGRPLIRVADPLLAFAEIVRHLRGRAPLPAGEIHPTALVHPTARLGEGVSVGPFAVIGEDSEIGAGSVLSSGVVVGRGCRIGAGSVLHPRVVLYDDCVLGDRVVIHANAVIGADGFGYRTQAGRHVKVPQLGWVEIENDVEIGASSTVDRGTFGPTRIGTGTKIDNLVMVGHNCQIGRHNILAAQVGVAGSSVTGEYVVMAGQVGVADHLRVGDRTIIAAKSGVLSDVAADMRVLGYPARPDSHMKRVWVLLDHLPDWRRDLKRVKEHLGLGDE